MRMKEWQETSIAIENPSRMTQRRISENLGVRYEDGARLPRICERIREMLPHRYPFLLVDKAEDFVPRTSIVGIKNVTHNEPFFPGHFPIDPVMPGVLIVEAMAQTGALLMSKTLDVAVADKVIMFMSIDGVKFRKPVEPGVLLTLEVSFVQKRARVCKFAGKAMIDLTVSGFCVTSVGGLPSWAAASRKVRGGAR